jgi:hypothetical protein
MVRTRGQATAEFVLMLAFFTAIGILIMAMADRHPGSIPGSGSIPKLEHNATKTIIDDDDK